MHLHGGARLYIRDIWLVPTFGSVIHEILGIQGSEVVFIPRSSLIGNLGNIFVCLSTDEELF